MKGDLINRGQQPDGDGSRLDLKNIGHMPPERAHDVFAVGTCGLLFRTYPGRHCEYQRKKECGQIDRRVLFHRRHLLSLDSIRCLQHFIGSLHGLGIDLIVPLADDHVHHLFRNIHIRAFDEALRQCAKPRGTGIARGRIA
jgi:hypothetical protein